MNTVYEAGTRQVVTGVSLQFMAKLVHLGLNVVSSLAIINHLSPARYGDFVLVLVVTTVLGLVCDFGLVRVAVREVARDADLEERAVGTVVALRLGLAAVSAGLVQLVMLAMGTASDVRAAAAVASLFFVCDALLAVAVVFHVRLRQQYEALAITIAEVIETAIVLVLVAHGGTLQQLVAAPVVGGIVGVAVAVAAARLRFRTRVRFDRSLVRPLLRAATPVAANGLIGLLVLKLDGLLLGALRPSREIGLYGAAFQPIEYLLIAIVTAVTVVLPLLARAHSNDTLRFAAMYRRGTELVLGLTAPLALVVVVLAPTGVALAYSDAYAPSVRPLRLLAVALLPMSVCAWQAVVLLAAGRQRLTLAYNCGAFAGGLLLHLALIPAFGYMGAAAGTLVAMTATAAIACAVAGRVVGISLDRGRLGLLGGAHALALAALAAAVAAGVPLPLAGVLAAVIDIALLGFTGAVRPRELAGLLGERAPIQRADAAHDRLVVAGAP